MQIELQAITSIFQRERDRKKINKTFVYLKYVIETRI